MERRCSECSASLGADASPLKKTCSKSCRSKRSRRQARQEKARARAASYPEELQVAAKAGKALVDVAHETMKEELRPIVREAITEEVLQGVQTLVALTPKMIKTLAEDLDSPDDSVRQRAYTLGLRYTMGNPSVAPQPKDPGGQPLNVTFLMPRPGDTSTEADEAPQDADAVELRRCADCGQEKSDFVSGSDRCTDCHIALQKQVMERFGGDE